MKGILKKLVLLSLLLFVSMSSVACSLYTIIENEPNNNEENQPNNVQISDIKDYNLNGASLPSSITASENVTITPNLDIQREKPLSTIEQSYENVKGSAVAIRVESRTIDEKPWAGSGTIIDIENEKETTKNVFYILTCYHVIARPGAKINVYTVDEKCRNFGDVGYNQSTYTFTGTIGGLGADGKIDKKQAVTLVGGDKDSDIAVLRLYIDNSNTTRDISKIKKAKVLETKYALKNSDEIFIIGNPTGVLAGTVTFGRVAGNLRTIRTEANDSIVVRQLDAGAWHGSSGGGVYNEHGELCGVLNAGSDENIGINFAIPHTISTDAKEDNGFINIMRQLIGTATDTNYGYISNRRILFGFSVASDSQNSVPYILRVTPGSLAEKAHLAVGDIIVAIKINDEEKIDNVTYAQINQILKNLQAGSKIILYVTSQNNTSVITKEIPLTSIQYHFCNTDK